MYKRQSNFFVNTGRVLPRTEHPTELLEHAPTCSEPATEKRRDRAECRRTRRGDHAPSGPPLHEVAVSVDSWTHNKVARLLGIAEKHDPRPHPILATLFYTGMRVGEALGPLAAPALARRAGRGAPPAGRARRPGSERRSWRIARKRLACPLSARRLPLVSARSRSDSVDARASNST